jgi:hypothetical protein
MSKTRRLFSKREYSSDNGMMTSVWGPAAWMVLHMVSFNYPVNPTPEDRKNYRNFILSFGKVLPCGKCRENFKHTLERMPVSDEVLASRECFSRYVYRLHNDVNARLQKKCPNPTYCEVRDLYERFRARCGSSKSKTKKVHSTRKGKGNGLRKGEGGNSEKGCTEPLKGIKTRCLIRIVAKTRRAKTFSLDKSCGCKSKGAARRHGKAARTKGRRTRKQKRAN